MTRRVIAVLAVVVIGAAGVWWTLTGRSPEVQPAPQPRGQAQPPVCVVRWEEAPGGIAVPSSPCFGPAQRDPEVGAAWGFSHDEMGAVFAALHIVARLSAGGVAATAAVYRQSVGDPGAALAEIAGERSTASREEVRARTWWWRITGGDPRGASVQVSLAAQTAQTQSMGMAAAALDVELFWRDGDWRLRLPRPRAYPLESLDGYERLGAP